MAYTNLENNAITAITANFQLIIHAVSYILSILICYAFKALIPLLSKTMETLILPNHQTWPNYQTISKVIWNKVFEANFVEVSLSVENGVKIFAFFSGEFTKLKLTLWLDRNDRKEKKWNMRMCVTICIFKSLGTCHLVYKV